MKTHHLKNCQIFISEIKFHHCKFIILVLNNILVCPQQCSLLVRAGGNKQSNSQNKKSQNQQLNMLYCSYTFTNRLANVRRIPNRKERRDDVTASKASVADTLHNLLVRKGSIRHTCHTYAVRTKVAQHEHNTIVD